MRLGHRQLKILILVYKESINKADVYNLVFGSPVKDDTTRSRVAKSLIGLKNHGLINYERNYNDAIVSITEKGRKKVEEKVK